MKTLIFTIDYPPFKGGVSNVYKNIYDHWPKTNDIFVLHNNENKLIKKWVFPKWIFAFYQLGIIVQKEKIDHILVGHILPLGTVAYFFTKFKKVSYSVILHGMDLAYSQKKKRKKIISKKILANAKYIICMNSYTADLVKKRIEGINNEKIKVVNPGINPKTIIDFDLSQKLRKKYHLTDKIVLFSIGRLVKRKGFDTVLEVLSEAQKSVPNLFYVIAGDGPDKIYLKEKAKGIKNVFFLGKINDQEKWAWLKTCDIFVMPSRDIDGDFEGFGIVYMEASLAGKPIIAGDTGGVKDAVKDGYSGILVDPNNKHRLTEVITGLAQDENLRSTLGRQGRERAINEFNWEKQAKEFYNIINKNI